MRKIFTLIMITAMALVFAGCKTKIRPTNPVILGVENVVKAEIDEPGFDPLAGITAFDVKDGDITDKLEHTFKPSMLSKKSGQIYKISVTNEAGLTTSVNVTLLVGGAVPNLRFTGPSTVTYYKGSRDFQPLAEIKALDLDTNEELEVTVEEDDYSLDVAGTYNYVIKSTDKEGIPFFKNITLIVKDDYGIPVELPKGGDPIKISLWHANGNTITSIYKKYAEQFTKLMKEKGVNVVVDIAKGHSDYNVLRETFVKALTGAETPNIIQNYPDHVVEYSMHKNSIAPLTPYINHPVWGFNPDVEGESLEDILEAYRAENRNVLLNEEYVSLPFNKSTEVVVYNKNMFDAALNGKPFPKTWQELFEIIPEINKIKDNEIDKIVAKLKAANNIQKAEEIKSKFKAASWDSSGNAFITLTRQFGGEYTTRNNDGSGKLLFDNPTVRVMLNYFAEHGKDFNVPQIWDNSKYASDKFVLGYSAFSVSSTAGLRYNAAIESGKKIFDVGIAPMLYDADSPNSRVVIQQGTNMSIVRKVDPKAKPAVQLKQQQEQLVSWLFLKYITSTDIQVDWSLATGYSPVRASSYEHPDYLKFLENADKEIKDGATEEEYVLKLQAMAAKVIKEQSPYMFYDTPFIGSSKTREAVGEAFKRVMIAAATKTPEEVASEIEKAIKSAWDEASKIVR